MFKKKSVRAFIVMALLFVLVIVNGIFTLGSTRNNPSSAWRTQPGKAGDKMFEDYVILQVTTTDKNDKEISTVDEDGKTSVHIWVNVGEIKQTNTKNGYGVITAIWKSSTDFSSYTSSNKFTIDVQKGVDSSKGQNQYGWINYKCDKFYSYCKISTQDVMSVNEIVFTNDDGTVLPARVVMASDWVNDRFVDNVDVNKLSKSSTASSLVDEQTKFLQYSSLAKKYNFTSEEAAIVNSALTVYNGDGLYLDKHTGALGLELIIVGLSVFGINTLGVRIIPYIFFILTIGLLFALGRKMFKDTDAGVLFAVFYTLFGLPLAMGSLGISTTIMVFFAILALYFLYSFYSSVVNYVFTEEKRTFKAGRTALWAPLTLSALSFAMAFNVKTSSLFVLPALITLFVLGLIRVVNVYKHNEKLAEYEDEKINNKKQYRLNCIGSLIVGIVTYALFIFLLLLLFYGILGKAYIAHYEATGLLQAISMHNKGSLFAAEGATGEFIKWLVGAGSTVIYTGAAYEGRFANVYLAMNVAVQLIALCACIYSTIIIAMGKFGKNARQSVKDSANEYGKTYLVLLIGYLFSVFMYAFVKGAGIADYLLASVFAVGLIVLAFKLLQANDKKLFASEGKKGVALSTFMMTLALCLSLLFFGIGYVMFVGIEVSDVAAAILFKWWLW